MLVCHPTGRRFSYNPAFTERLAHFGDDIQAFFVLFRAYWQIKHPRK